MADTRMVDRTELGVRLHTLRFARRATLKDVELATGVPQSTVSRWERAQGERYPDIERLAALADFYGVDLPSLIGAEPPEGSASPGATLRIRVDRSAIEGFCRRWKIIELAFFGSVLRDDFRSDSDVDVLFTLADDARWSLFDEVRMHEELSELLGRSVDLVSRRAVEGSENWIRKRSILGSAEPYVVAG